MVLHLSLLGSFEVTVGSGQLVSFPTHKAKALLAYLALQRDQSHSREKLSDLLWGDSNQTRARANLRQALTRVRQALPAALPRCLVAENGTIRLDSATVRCDVPEFEKLTGQGTPNALEQAALLYRGDLLEGLLIDEEPFEDWLREERRRLRDLAIEGFRALLGHYEKIGASTRGVEIARRLLVLDPYHEETHRLLMLFYLDQGRRGAALGQYEECRRMLRRELDVEPEAPTQRLYEDIRDTSLPNPFIDDPERSRRAVGLDDQTRRTSHAALALVERSPWGGANWSKPSVAVLPFDCLSDRDDQRYLCDGIVEDIITDLARFRDIHVIARNSSFAYRDLKVSPDVIGRELGVRYLVEGSLRRGETKVRINAQLIEAESGRHIWAERFDEPLIALADLRDGLTRQITGTLVGRIEDHHLKAVKGRAEERWETYDCWLRGNHALRKVNWDNFNKANACFERALAIDPSYARAYSGLAMAQFKAWTCLNWSAWWKLQDNAFDYAKKALALDDADHHVHCMIGLVHLFLREFALARHHLERAETLNPNDARTLANAAMAWAFLGEGKRGVRMAEAAVRLDPYHPDWYMAGLGLCYYVVRDYQRAIEAMELTPDAFTCDTRAYLAAAYAQSGNIAAAKRHIAEFLRGTSEQWGGDPATEAPRYVEAMMRHNPFLKAEDAAHFAEGLSLAGLRMVPIDGFGVQHERWADQAAAS